MSKDFATLGGLSLIESCTSHVHFAQSAVRNVACNYQTDYQIKIISVLNNTCLCSNILCVFCYICI